jgi:hypothetical protein
VPIPYPPAPEFLVLLQVPKESEPQLPNPGPWKAICLAKRWPSHLALEAFPMDEQRLTEPMMVSAVELLGIYSVPMVK